jgi:hypothetical protein
MSFDKGPALIGALQADSEQLAIGKKPVPEQLYRTVGHIGLLLCDVARHATTNEQARAIAAKEAHDAAKGAVDTHVIVCKGTSGSPTSFRGAAMIALSHSPWAIVVLTTILVVCYHPAPWMLKVVGQ